MVTEVFRMLKLYQELQETLVVGIGYPMNVYRETQGLRIRDLTPTEGACFRWRKPPVQHSRNHQQRVKVRLWRDIVAAQAASGSFVLEVLDHFYLSDDGEERSE